jgi:predicted metal-dependent hydrolase
MTTTITVKDINTVDYKYFNNNYFNTYLLSALSSTFKEGEKFFMKSLTNYFHSQPEYKTRIISFSKEENAHTAVHIQLNKIISDLHNNDCLIRLEALTGKLLNFAYKLTNEDKLLITECLEHITYCLCKEALDTKEFEKLTSDAKKVFLYHATEETGISHSTIAGDLYETINGSRLKRHIIIYPTSFILLSIISYYIYCQYRSNNCTIQASKSELLVDLYHGTKYLLQPKGWFVNSIAKIFKTW